MKNVLVLFHIFLLISVLGCSKTNEPNPAPEINITELIKSPTTLQIDSTNCNITVLLYRDFMPIAPIDGREMTAIINISTSNSSNFPSNIDADKLWIIDSTNIWESTLADNFIIDSIFQISKKATNGPKWETGILVDAIVRIVEDDSIYYFLKSEDIKIERIN